MLLLVYKSLKDCKPSGLLTVLERSQLVTEPNRQLSTSHHSINDGCNPLGEQAAFKELLRLLLLHCKLMEAKF